MRLKWGLLLLVAVSVFSGCRRAPSTELLLSDDKSVRDTALAQLAELPPEKKKALIDPLMIALGSDDSRISQRASTAFVVIGSPAVPRLIRGLEGGTLFVKLSAAETLARMGEEAAPARDILTTTLKDPHPLLRAEAAIALGLIGPPPPEVLAATQPLLKDPDEGVRQAAQETLTKWGVSNNSKNS